MEEYLVYVEYIGCDLDGNYIYKMDFSTQPEVVWGESWNVVPAAICGHIPPDPNTIFKTGKLYSPEELNIAVKSTCFSMQDCIDGIIPLIFSEIDENTLEYNEKPFFIHFGETFTDVENILSAVGITFFEVEEVEKGDESAIDNLIDSMDDNEEYDGMEDF